MVFVVRVDVEISDDNFDMIKKFFGSYEDFTEMLRNAEIPYKTLSVGCHDEAVRAAINTSEGNASKTMKAYVTEPQLEPANTNNAEDKPCLCADNIPLTFGKHKGKTLSQVAVLDRQYLEWLIENFPIFNRNKELVIKLRSIKANPRSSYSNQDPDFDQGVPDQPF